MSTSTISPTASSEARVLAPLTGSAVAGAREGWVDSAKGLGIVLVVVGHAVRGMIDAGLFPAAGTANTAFIGIYTFHMPLFFFLSGLFVHRRLQADRDAFLRSSLIRLLWPYVLWSLLQALVIQSVGSLANRPFEWGSISYLAIFWHPMSQFWFLYLLALFTVVSYWVVPRLGVPALLVLSVFAIGLRDLVELPFVPVLACCFAPMYAFGVLVGQGRSDAGAALRGWRSVGITVAAAVAWVVCVAVLMAHGGDYWSTRALPAAVAGCVAVIGLARTPWLSGNRVLHVLGRGSMPIYLLHVMFVAGTRIALNRMLGVSEAHAIFVVVVCAGLLGPLLVQRLAERLSVAGWLGLR